MTYSDNALTRLGRELDIVFISTTVYVKRDNEGVIVQYIDAEYGDGPMIQFSVNGDERRFDGDPELPLLWYLRDILGLTGTKFGCGAALCGCCTVHLNGDAIPSCSVAVRDVAGAEITTVEGISGTDIHPVQKAWMEHNVPQCGYCQAGQIMQAVALLRKNPKPSDQDIDAVMANNICRCGTYQRIRAAIHAAAADREAL